MIKRSQDNIAEIHANRFGGNGEQQLKMILTKEEMLGKGRNFAHTIMPPGVSTGLHTHTDSLEAYYILKGKALVNDNGHIQELYPGDVLFTKLGESHSIENIGEDNLEFIAIVLLVP